jgi:hypothetical protein
MMRPTKDLSWFGLAGMGVIFGVIYAIAILVSRFFDEYDWGKIESLVPLTRRIRRIGRIA